MSPKIPGNVVYSRVPKDNYAASVLEQGDAFDIIVIDGIDRVNCCRFAVEALSPNGVIIWDNSDREEDYAEGYNFLQKRDFKRLEFFGFGPVNSKPWGSSIFYRADNCLNI